MAQLNQAFPEQDFLPMFIKVTSLKVKRIVLTDYWLRQTGEHSALFIKFVYLRTFEGWSDLSWINFREAPPIHLTHYDPGNYSRRTHNRFLKLHKEQTKPNTNAG